MGGLRIREMDHIVLNVADIERALTFYVDVLGLSGERVEQFRKGEVGFPSVRINDDTIIDLMRLTGERADAASRNLNHFCLVAEETDLAALSASLKDRGVHVVTEPVSRWGAHGRATSIYIQDPDENEVEIRCY